MVALPQRSRRSRPSQPLGDRSPFSSEPASSPSSPVIARLLSHAAHRGEGGCPSDISLYSRNGRRKSLKREPEDDDEGSDDNSVSLPSIQRFLPRHESLKRPHTTGPLWTPSTTPELSEDDVYSRRPSLFLAPDPIIDKLNHLRIVENKNPLPPLEGLYDRDLPNQATRKWIAIQNTHDETYQQPLLLRDIKRRRAKCRKVSHCNIKYLVEELDYIRYQRVDLAQAWTVVESYFVTMFPMPVFPEPRKTQGLQGVNYRQNKCLPLISNGQLVFMDNGHVEPVWIKTREQTERKHLYTLVNLFPERAMKYPWVTSMDSQRAYKLNEERQRQMEKERLEAIERGTYVERLPSDIPCGCCPAEDRKRDKTHPNNKPFPKKLRRELQGLLSSKI